MQPLTIESRLVSAKQMPSTGATLSQSSEASAGEVLLRVNAVTHPAMISAAAALYMRLSSATDCCMTAYGAAVRGGTAATTPHACEGACAVHARQIHACIV